MSTAGESIDDPNVGGHIVSSRTVGSRTVGSRTVGSEPQSSSPAATRSRGRHVLQDLGWETRSVGDELHGSAVIVPEMHVPGTGHLRTSILAAWADVLSGLLAVTVMRPRVPVTLDLDVNLLRPAPGAGTVRGVGTTRKAGRSVFVASVEFTDGAGDVFAVAGASFMAAPDHAVQMHPDTSVDMPVAEGTRLPTPFADHAGCERRRPGTAVLAGTSEGGDVRNAANTLNGGLIVLAVEEASLSLSLGTTLSSLSMRYLQPIRTGPAIAQATVDHGLGRVEVRESSRDHRLAGLAVTRVFDV
jgi:acyl-coenzyme A thioesterase PaaI-like protein